MSYITRAVNTGGLAFEVELQGHTFWLDGDESVGGTNKGPRPKALLLSGLAGCTGMDVASILTKMKMPYERLTLEIDAHQTDTHPKVYDTIHIRYIFKGDELDMAKIEKAIKLSQEKYCGASAMLGETAEITHEIVVE